VNVQQLRVGVNVHRQRNVAVAHRRLRGTRRHAPLAEQRPERRAQGVNNHRPAALVALGDPGQLQIAVEYAAHPRRHVEQQRLGRQAQRQRFAVFAGLLLQPLQLAGQPAP
jgi:hypothetical protein